MKEDFIDWMPTILSYIYIGIIFFGLTKIDWCKFEKTVDEVLIEMCNKPSPEMIELNKKIDTYISKMDSLIEVRQYKNNTYKHN